jgi:hypothetical protein
VVRCEAAGPEKPEMYSLEYIEDFFRTENDAAGRGSFAAVERSKSDRLLKAGLGLELLDHVVQSVLMQGGYRQEL